MDESAKQVIPAYLEHGGDVAEAEALYGRPRGGWLDLSTGINPHSYPMPEVTSECWTRLPDSRAYAKLRRAAADCYGAGDPALVTPAPGAQALIQWLPRLRPRSQVSVLGPTYNEHAHAWCLAGHRVEEVNGFDMVDRQAEVVVVVNPNNPDGRLLETGALAELSLKLASRGGWLVVDESFADVTPKASISARAGMPGLVVLRSFGKFFGLAGVRLGFALTGAELAGALAHALGPWAVSGPAAEVGTTALADAKWISATRRRLKEEAKRLDGLLTSHGMQVIGGCDLFRLVKTTEAAEIHARLARSGVLVRRFSQYPDRLRFGLPGANDDWDRLEKALGI
ncbi:MAG: threonine-phosphate decarboxylase [Rhodospirillales bacterium RIFCSPLOWO2_12_FULL_58_28]|nr:MAG: threonine-phosphate decarboxylase [Rhodospirillales bacterium RIFCSPLOWO2_02_FULL_58_16]OHC78126.1 MAG: threonine-phosphate decarboxylase [Rhodospirillales bacterium RIFCSPLOWO2_12_FULL_58_28]